MIQEKKTDTLVTSVLASEAHQHSRSKGRRPTISDWIHHQVQLVVEDHKDFGRVFAGTMLATNVTLSLDELFYRTSTTDKKESIRQLSMTPEFKST